MARRASEEMACRDHHWKSKKPSDEPWAILAPVSNIHKPRWKHPPESKKKKKSHENRLAKDLLYVSCWPVWIVPLACIYLLTVWGSLFLARQQYWCCNQVNTCISKVHNSFTGILINCTKHCNALHLKHGIGHAHHRNITHILTC